MTKSINRKRSRHKFTAAPSKRRKVSNGKSSSTTEIIIPVGTFCKHLSIANKYRTSKRYTSTNGSNTRFCDLYPSISFNYVSPKWNCYIFRSFENTDMNALQELDKQMHDMLSDQKNPITPYGDYLNLITDTNRMRWHHWRTITCIISSSNDDQDASLVGKPVGFIIYKYVKQSKHVELFWISIDEKHRRNGIARTLIKLMINQSMKEWTAKHFKLHVLTTNYSAIQMYEKIGFQAEKCKSDYPINGYSSFRYSLKIRRWLMEK